MNVPARAILPAQTPAPAERSGSLRHLLSLSGMGLAVLAAWLLVHPYAGLLHDSTIYTLLALQRLHPHELTNDIFLRFGSQDRYTLFGPLFAAAIHWMDLEPAAALLVLFSQIAILVCAGLLACRFMPAPLAILAVGLLVVMPSDYGSGQFFHYIEDFPTPRLPAAALTFLALSLASSGRVAWATSAMVAAILIHPLIATAGIALFAVLYFGLLQPCRTLTIATAGIAVVIVLALASVPPFSRFSSDAQWLSIVKATSPYLFVLSWSAPDWAHSLLPLALLASGTLFLETPAARRLCLSALIIGCRWIFLSGLFCEGLQGIFINSCQPWRWLWLSNALAVLLAPQIVRDGWRASTLTRCAILLLGSAWLFRDGSPFWITLPLALVAALTHRCNLPNRVSRPLLLGSSALLLIAALLNFGDKVAYDLHDPLGTGEAVAQWLKIWNSDGAALVLPLVLVWWTLRLETALAAACLATAGLIACVAAGKAALPSWTARHYTPALRSAFASWRAGIPDGAEVLWPGIPVGGWYLLERPSYWSYHQAVGAIFSRPKAIELQRRTEVMKAVLGWNREATSGTTPTSGIETRSAFINSVPALRTVCADPALGYVVTPARLGPSLFAPVVLQARRPDKPLFLYRCADFH